jgi:hypothetical protein
MGLGPEAPISSVAGVWQILSVASGPDQFQPAQFFFPLFSEIPANMQILYKSYLLNRNSECKVFYMKVYQKNG